MNPELAAEQAATTAAKNGYSIIPVGITSPSFNKSELNKFARCPDEEGADTPCSKYFDLAVDSVDDLNGKVKALTVTAGCA